MESVIKELKNKEERKTVALYLLQNNISGGKIRSEMKGHDSFLISSIFYLSICPIISSSDYIPNMQLLTIFVNVSLVQTFLISPWISVAPLKQSS